MTARRVAVGGEEVAERVEGQAERVHLAVAHDLGGRAVGAEAVGVAGLHRDRGCAFAGTFGVVG